MKQLGPFWRCLLRLLLVSLFVAAVTGCSRISSGLQSADRDTSLVGKYRFTQHEAASEIELGADGAFTYVFIYGALDEGAMGKWRSTDRKVTLEVDNAKQGNVTPPPTATLELRRDGENLVLTRQSNELVYVKRPEIERVDFDGKLPKGDSRIPVDIIGYNYTNRVIDSFNVNGYDGGRLTLSTLTSSGGSPMCCYYYLPGISFPHEVEVEWAPSASDGPWTKTKAVIPEPTTDRPRYLEIHFYPDGHIEGELTEDFSLPRLKLTKKNPNER